MSTTTVVLTTSSSGQQRAPSTRPIDERWDRSRGIVFNCSRRPTATKDFTWNPTDGLIFAGSPAERGRSYATRPLPGTQTTSVDPSNPHALSSGVSRKFNDKLQQQLAAEQKARSEEKVEADRTKRALEEQVKVRSQELFELRLQSEAQRKQLQQFHTADLAGKLAVERRKYEELERKHVSAEQSHENDTDLLKKKHWEQMVNKERVWEEERDRLLDPYERLYDKARHEALEDLQTARAALRQQKMQIDLERTNTKAVLEQDREQQQLSLDQAHAQLNMTLKRYYQDANESLRREYEQALQRKTVERKDYTEYRKIWDIMSVMGTVEFGLLEFSRVLQARAKAWRVTLENYSGENIDRWFPHLYRDLDRKIRQFLITKHLEAESVVTRLTESREKMKDALKTLQTAGHKSRSFTRPLRFEPDLSEVTKAELLNQSMYIIPWRHFHDEAVTEAKLLKQRLREPLMRNAKKAMHDEARNLACVDRSGLKFWRVLMAFSELETAKAAPYYLPVEKEVFALTFKLNERHRETSRVWANIRLSRPRFERGFEQTSALETKLRKAIRVDLNEMRAEKDGLVDLVRKRRYLQSMIDDPGNDSKIDRIIQDAIDFRRRTFLGEFTTQYPSIKSQRSLTFTRPAPPPQTMNRRRARSNSLVAQSKEETDRISQPVVETGNATEASPGVSTGRSRTIRRAARAARRADQPLVSSSEDNNNATSSQILAFTSTAPMLANHSSQCHDRTVLAPDGLLAPWTVNTCQNRNSAELLDESLLRNVQHTVPASSDQYVHHTEQDLGAVDMTRHVSRGETSTASSQESFEPETSSQESGDSAIESPQPSPSTSTPEIGEQTSPTPQLEYRISNEEYRNAYLSSPNSNASFWSYKLYKNGEGKYPVLYYCTNVEQAEIRVKEFLNEAVVGFDIEWERGAVPGRSSIKDNVSLIQLASESKIVLLHLGTFRGTTAYELLPPSLRMILKSPNIAKVGVNIRGDATRIEKCLGVSMKGLFELSHLYRVVTFGEHKPGQVNWRLVSLADQVKEILLLPLKKDAVRTSRWSKKLEMQQSEYAASDAYAGFQLYHALEAKRNLMDPTPPRPAFHEEQKPIVLGDGSEIWPSSYLRSRPRAAVDGDFDEFFDAVEYLENDPSDDLSGVLNTAGLSLSGLSISTSPRSNQIDNSPRPGGVGRASARSSVIKSTTPRTGPPPSEQVDQAEQWIRNFRSSLPHEYDLRVKDASLRAYHLWHAQRFDCLATGALLRVPPLAPSTVATYIMEALKHENLPFEPERLRETAGPLEYIPDSVQGRYAKVLSRSGRDL